MTESDQNSLKDEVWPIDSAYCLIVRQFRDDVTRLILSDIYYFLIVQANTDE